MSNVLALRCPQCSASLTIEEGRHSCFCNYCGTKILLNTDLNNNSQNVKEMLKRAKQLLEMRSWYEAADICDRVLESDSENGDAHLIKLLCECFCSDITQIGNTSGLISTHKSYNSAIAFSDEKIRNYLIECNRKQIEQQKADKAVNSGKLTRQETAALYSKSKKEQKAFASQMRYDLINERADEIISYLNAQIRGAINNNGCRKHYDLYSIIMRQTKSIGATYEISYKSDPRSGLNDKEIKMLDAILKNKGKENGYKVKYFFDNDGYPCRSGYRANYYIR